MAEFKKYENKYAIMVDGKLLGSTTGIKFGNEFNRQDLYTIIAGFQGKSEGTGKFSLDVSSLLLESGIEVDIDKYSQENKVCELTIQLNERSLTSKGQFSGVKYDFSMDKAADVSFQFEGTVASFS